MGPSDRSVRNQQTVGMYLFVCGERVCRSSHAFEGWYKYRTNCVWRYIYVSVELYLHRWETNYWMLFRQIMSSVLMGRQSVRLLKHADTVGSFISTLLLSWKKAFSNVALNSEAGLKACKLTVCQDLCVVLWI